MKRSEEVKPSLNSQDDKQETGWRVRVRNVMRVVGGHRKPPKRKTEVMNKFYFEEQDSTQAINVLVSDGGDRMMLEAAEEEYGIIPRSRIIRGHKVLIYTLPNVHHLISKGACEGVATGGVGDEESSGNSCCETSQETLFFSEVHVESRIGSKESTATGKKTEKKDGVSVARSGGVRISRNQVVVDTSDGRRTSRKVRVPGGLGEVEISGIPAERSVGQKISKVPLADGRNAKQISGIPVNECLDDKISRKADLADGRKEKEIPGISADGSVGQKISGNAYPVDSSDDKGISGILASGPLGQKISEKVPPRISAERSVGLKLSGNTPVSDELEEKGLSTNDKRSHPVRLKKRMSRNHDTGAEPPSKIAKIRSFISPKDVHTSQMVMAGLNQSKISNDSVAKLNKSLPKGVQLDLEDPAKLQEEISVVPGAKSDQQREGDCANVNSHCRQVDLSAEEAKKPVSLFQSPKLCVGLDGPCSQQLYFGPNPRQLNWSQE